MARKNKQKQHSGSKKSVNKGKMSAIDKKEKMDGSRSNYDDVPPRSMVKNNICVKGSAKPMQSTISQLEIKDSLPAFPNGIQERGDILSSECSPKTLNSEGDFTNTKQEALDTNNITTFKNFHSEFIDPRDSYWYIDPLHRISTSRSLQLSDYDTQSYSDDFARYDEEDEQQYNNYLKMSRKFEKEALERATSTSLYELELCRLRKEKLKLEESYLLKKKCELELERTRGPKPKWYELKTPQFTVEMERYNNIMSNRKWWNEIIDYRYQLNKTI